MLSSNDEEVKSLFDSRPFAADADGVGLLESRFFTALPEVKEPRLSFAMAANPPSFLWLSSSPPLLVSCLASRCAGYWLTKAAARCWPRHTVSLLLSCKLVKIWLRLSTSASWYSISSFLSFSTLSMLD